MAGDNTDGGIRVMVDRLSNSVNSCIPDNQFHDIPFSIKYPTIDMVMTRLKKWAQMLFYIKQIWILLEI